MIRRYQWLQLETTCHPRQLKSENDNEQREWKPKKKTERRKFLEDENEKIQRALEVGSSSLHTSADDNDVLFDPDSINDDDNNLIYNVNIEDLPLLRWSYNSTYDRWSYTRSSGMGVHIFSRKFLSYVDVWARMRRAGEFNIQNSKHKSDKSYKMLTLQNHLITFIV